jgi:threonyl-tRNA synthetase
VEHYVGAFPLWLSPVQVRVLPITDQHLPYAEEIRRNLSKEGFRVEADSRNEKLGFKIREAQLEKVPYMVVVGEEEATKRQLSVRKRNGEQLPSMTIEAFVNLLKEEDRSRS